MADRRLLPVGTCVTGQAQPWRAQVCLINRLVFQNHENNRAFHVPESLFLTNGRDGSLGPRTRVGEPLGGQSAPCPWRVPGCHGPLCVRAAAPTWIRLIFQRAPSGGEKNCFFQFSTQCSLGLKSLKW